MTEPALSPFAIVFFKRFLSEGLCGKELSAHYVRALFNSLYKFGNTCCQLNDYLTICFFFLFRFRTKMSDDVSKSLFLFLIISGPIELSAFEYPCVYLVRSKSTDVRYLRKLSKSSTNP